MLSILYIKLCCLFVYLFVLLTYFLHPTEVLSGVLVELLLLKEANKFYYLFLS